MQKERALSQLPELTTLASCPRPQQKTGLKRLLESRFVKKPLSTHQRATFWMFLGTDLPKAPQNPPSCACGNRGSGTFGLIRQKDGFASRILFGLSYWEGSWKRRRLLQSLQKDCRVIPPKKQKAAAALFRRTGTRIRYVCFLLSKRTDYFI